MTTYLTLRNRALARVGQTGSSEAEDIAEAALEEAMRFVAFHVRVPSLVGSATAVAPASPELEANAITLGGAGFNISATFATPDRLYVKATASTVGYGTPYEFLEYNHFIDLKSIPSGARSDLFSSASFDERPKYSYTITPSDKIWAEPLTEANSLTFFYRKTPAPYADGTTPEINTLFDYILVNGAEVVLKEWEREPAEMLHMWDLFEAKLGPDIKRYDLWINGQRKRSHIKIHKSYRPQ